MQLEPVIGLEIHVQLKTASKMFCSCKNSVENPPNTSICPICMGHPGTLPVPNKEAIAMATKAILALDGTVAPRSIFARKHYFYPDLPKGYQISQYDEPIGVGGWLDISINKEERRLHLVRLHLEEDAAKLFHAPNGGDTLIDFNRAGSPLAEIVTEPEFKSPDEAKLFLQELRELLRALKVSDADMEKGNMRCDANISMRPAGTNELFPKIEVKNINSFRAVERALHYEIARQTKLWEAGTPPLKQETRGWNDAEQITESQRSKEGAHDYRYFPDPDIPPLIIGEEEIEFARRSLPELPQDKRQRFSDEYAMDTADARVIIADHALANWTEHVLSELREWLSATDGDGTAEEKWETGKKKLVKLTTGWITSKLLALMNEKNVTGADLAITPENFAELITMLHDRRVNSTTAQEVLKAMFDNGGIDPSTYIAERGLGQVSDTASLETVAAGIVAAHPAIVAKYKSGQTSVLQFLVGQVMKETKGRADPEMVATLLQKHL